MAKLITICGATGGVGGAVARRMLKDGWNVRAITRNTESAAAKALAEQGAELTTANYDDVASLEKAFKDSNVIFGLTNIFEYLLEKTLEDAAMRERQQMVNIATAANAIPSLEHFILHTLPAGEKLNKGTFVPHFDGKDQAADIIKSTLPSLAQKTTFFWIGFFSSNFWQIPMIKPTELPNSYGAHVFLQPVPSKTPIPCAGDVEHNAGEFVKAILAKPEVSLPAKYAFLYTSQGTFQDYLQAWIDVTGRRTTYVETTMEAYEQIWGPFGTEVGLMLKACTGVKGSWKEAYGDDVVSAEDLGIPEGALIDLKGALEKNKELL